MSDQKITADEVKQMLKEAKPGPWRLNGWESVIGITINYQDDSPMERANVELAEAAPDLARTVIEQAETIESLKETNDELEEDFYLMLTKRNFFRDETRVAHEQIERLQDALREGEVMRRKVWVEAGANIDPYGPVDWEAQYESLVYGDMEEE